MYAWLFMLRGTGVVSAPCGGETTTTTTPNNCLLLLSDSAADPPFCVNIKSFIWINNCEEDVELRDWSATPIVVPKKQAVSINQQRTSCSRDCNRITWQYLGSWCSECVPDGRYQDFIELNENWGGAGQTMTYPPTYSAYFGFSNASKFSLSGGSCVDEVARFLPSIEDPVPAQNCGPPTSSHPHRCAAFEKASSMTCSTKCAPQEFQCPGSDWTLCESWNPSSWQCGPPPEDANSDLHKNWMLCNYWYETSLAGATGFNHTLSSGNYVNYWCGSNSCRPGLDFMKPGVKVGETCKQDGWADFTITTCAEPF